MTGRRVRWHEVGEISPLRIGMSLVSQTRALASIAAGVLEESLERSEFLPKECIQSSHVPTVLSTCLRLTPAWRTDIVDPGPKPSTLWIHEDFGEI